MRVEQITYGSVKRRQMKGYQVIGTSPGIETAVSSAFCRWAPSHHSLEEVPGQHAEDAWALSFFPVSASAWAIARSVHGGPEYSGRGGLAVVTGALILSREQLAAYQFHAVDVARTALCLGYLLLPPDDRHSLPVATLTAAPLSLMAPTSDFADRNPARLPEHAVHWVAREACSLLRDQQRVMIVGPCDPLPILTLLLDQLSAEERAETTFACGLKPSQRRDFRLQFTQQTMSPKLERDLERAGCTVIDLARLLLQTD